MMLLLRKLNKASQQSPNAFLRHVRYMLSPVRLSVCR